MESWDWQGEQFNVKVLYSYAGVATQILVKIIEDKTYFLMDVGDGILRDLIGYPSTVYENIKFITLSHGHFDHVGGLFSLLAFFRMINRTETLTLICPFDAVEIQGIIKAFNVSYAESIPYDLVVKEIETNTKIGSIQIIPFPVQHKGSVRSGVELPRIPAHGYVIERNGERIAFTGDTGYYKGLENHVKDVDFLLIEGTYEDKKTKFHLTITEAEKIGKIAKKYHIIHKFPPLRKR